MVQHTPVLKLLPPAELAVLAGSTRSNTQAAWLQANGIPFMIGSDRRVKVLAAEVLSRLQSAPCCLHTLVEEQGEPVALDGLEMESATDKLTEQQMAADLGITHRALRTRRHRGKIPEGVWMKVGRVTYYSRQKYEQWLESVWPADVGQKVVVTSPRARRKLGSRAPFPLLV